MRPIIAGPAAETVRRRGKAESAEDVERLKTKQSTAADGVKTVATNRKAFHDYFIEDRTEAGLVLTGTEVKSLREGRAQLKDSYVQFRAGEAYPDRSPHLRPTAPGSWSNHLPGARAQAAPPPARDRQVGRRRVDARESPAFRCRSTSRGRARRRRSRWSAARSSTTSATRSADRDLKREADRDDARAVALIRPAGRRPRPRLASTPPSGSAARRPPRWTRPARTRLAAHSFHVAARLAEPEAQEDRLRRPGTRARRGD